MLWDIDTNGIVMEMARDVLRPGETARGSSDTLVSLIDVIPTLADLSGVAIQQQIDGRSFAEVLRHPQGTGHRSYILAETFKLGGDESARLGGETVTAEDFNAESDSVNLSVHTSDLNYVFRYKDIEEL